MKIKIKQLLAFSILFNLLFGSNSIFARSPKDFEGKEVCVGGTSCYMAGLPPMKSYEEKNMEFILNNLKLLYCTGKISKTAYKYRVKQLAAKKKEAELETKRINSVIEEQYASFLLKDKENLQKQLDELYSKGNKPELNDQKDQLRKQIRDLNDDLRKMQVKHWAEIDSELDVFEEEPLNSIPFVRQLGVGNFQE